MRSLLIAASLAVATPTLSAGQLVAARANPVAYGHHHINASDVEAHKRFWIDALGGRAVTLGTSSAEVIAFPNVLVFLRDRTPTGGTKGTVVNHVGFTSRDIEQAVARLIEGGFRMVTEEELPGPGYEVRNHVAQRPGGNRIAYVMGPDEMKVELLENTAISEPIQLHHIHWAVPDGEAVRTWYAEHLGAVPGSRIGQPAGDMPGVNLTFGPTAEPVGPTQGRALDHIGFEVQDLRALLERLERSGVEIDRGYAEIESMGIAIAFLTDPWGTYIELTEGLAEVD